jgi:hypothetical protein
MFLLLFLHHHLSFVHKKSQEVLPDPIRESLLGPYSRNALVGTTTAQIHSAQAKKICDPISEVHCHAGQFCLNLNNYL